MIQHPNDTIDRDVMSNIELMLDAGFSIFPLADGTKEAAVRWKDYQEERADWTIVTGWLHNVDKCLFAAIKKRPGWPVSSRRNYGIVTGAISGIIVLDLDNAEAIAEAFRRGIPLTWMSVTPRGLHVLFRHPGHVVRNSVGKIHEGMDIRGDRGMMVAPCSHYIPTAEEAEHGKVEGHYQWLTRPDECELADMPEWLATSEWILPPVVTAPERPEGYIYAPPTAVAATAFEKRRSAYMARVLAGAIEELSTARAGTRKDTANRVGFRLGQWVSGGCLDHNDAVEALEEGCRWLPGDKEPHWRSGLRDGQRRPKYLPEASPATVSTTRRSRISLATF